MVRRRPDTTAEPYAGDRSDILPTFDNRATVDELRFMARICDATSDAACLHSFGRGLDYVLAAQYPNGGWPQCYPLRGDYSDHITFNDDAMVRVMQFMQAVGNDHTYAFVADAKRLACRKAFAKGVECILKCQIVNAGGRTVWCAQHDAETLAPAKARAYELPSFSGSESVGIVRLLMSVDQPAPEIRDAVEAAVRWLDEHAIAGQRLDTVTDESGRANRVLIADPAAGPLWARFYDLETGRPFVCDRDGIPKAGLAEIGFERRNGYSWFGDSARKLLQEDYPAWKRRLR